MAHPFHITSNYARLKALLGDERSFILANTLGWIYTYVFMAKHLKLELQSWEPLCELNFYVFLY